MLNLSVGETCLSDNMKKIYFTTICFLPIVLTVLYPAIFLFHLPFPISALPCLVVYVWIGLVVILVDLWRAKLDTEKKTLWTIAILLAGLATLPIYWFRFLKNRPNQPPEPPGSSGSNLA